MEAAHDLVINLDPCECDANFFDTIPGPGVFCKLAPQFHFKNNATCRLGEMQFGTTQLLSLVTGLASAKQLSTIVLRGVMQQYNASRAWEFAWMKQFIGGLL